MQKKIIGFATIALVGIVLIYAILQGSLQETQLKNKIEEYFSKNFNISVKVTKLQDIGSVYNVSLYFERRNLTVFVSKDGNYLFSRIINISKQSITTKTELKNKIESFFLENFNISIDVTNIQDIGSVYQFNFYFNGEKFRMFASKDGRYLFPTFINLSAPITTTSIPPFSPKQSNFPDVKLFVMSFCPYGTQAELFMKPVYDAFKNYANFSLIFIVSVNGENLSKVSSLHGRLEVLEDARQICIQKYYGKDVLWNYVEGFDNNCYPNSIYDKESYIACTSEEEKKLNINSTIIENCMNSNEVIQELMEHQRLTQQYNVHGSPTLVINNSTYNDNFGRSIGSYQRALCMAFLSQPNACFQNLTSSSTTTTHAGKC